ncbi:Rne/Rng family ribonuclease [Moraxella catarrhalis]|uniref:Rne/Rng family ribonuclease n=1 Tax=Moraxella catarrhalis TaxID=480 RepID=UPI00098903A2|nr:Rne/Rng family ribonuclease [Moraxella catarrhalis]MCG6820087.1 Rne/Rng family ribonuclease [Moraxella catarrhalis]MCG6832055.1 Rne/Rng family ribonuclease [Moraxella catarrhalis]MDE4519225.1 Rne/Rng family ribonuclease [Moraxella catarrhalis]MPW53191.1 Rne/Rng family ribonuclease [Moraxella catarrhalis]MPX46491.1 ribonuclease E [Moraxella catarrhalis]
MKRILINATHSEEIRVALCKDNHLYDFDLENRTREQKKANIYKGHITRVEPSLEAAFVEYGSARQGFLPLREIAPEYLNGNTHEDSIKQLIKEGDEIIVQVEKEERGNKGAALSSFISLAGRYLVLMPNNPKAGGISRQISGKVREEMKQIIAGLNLPKNMSVIVRTAGLGKGADDLQNDLDHLLDIWKSIQEQNKKRPSPCLVHQEAGVVTRAVRDYLRDDIGEVWIDSENAYDEAANFIKAVMPTQLSKLRKYTDYEPMFARFGIERQIETAYQREVRLPSGGSIVIDQTEALVAIDINSSKSTKGSDVAETAYHTNLEAADEIARQLRLRDMGGLIVIDFIDMNDPRHQKDVEKRLIEATRHDRARVQFSEISKFGLMQMSRQRLRPSLEESTGYICPRCHGNGMIRDLRSLSLSIMRQIEQIALKERMGEIQAEVPTDIAAFLLNEKRESLVYLEQDSGARITILPHAHLESPNFSLHFNPDGFAPSSYERIADTEEKENIDRGYEVNWQTDHEKSDSNRWQKPDNKPIKKNTTDSEPKPTKPEPQAVAWLSNLFAPKPQAKVAGSLGTADAALAIEALVNGGAVSLGAAGRMANIQAPSAEPTPRPQAEDKRHKKSRNAKKESGEETAAQAQPSEKTDKKTKKERDKEQYPKREAGSRRESRGEIVRGETLHKTEEKADKADKPIRADKPKSEKTEKLPHQKAANPKEVVLHVSSIKAAENNTQVIHLSLDGSKSTKPTKDETSSAKDDAKIAPKANSNQAIKAPKEPIPTKPKHEAEPITQSDESGEMSALHTVSATTGVEPKLAEKIQTLAKSMNKATNDPRVVQIALQQTQAINLNAITAGALILRVLGKSATGNFVNDFITAMTKMSTPAQFDFANFGYSPLDTATKNEFGKLTQATAQASAPQGRTEAIPRPITRRAANDPRGQHPEYIEATSPNNDQVSKTIAQHSNQASPDTFDHAVTPADTKHKESKIATDSSSDSDNSQLSKADDAVEHQTNDAIDATTLAAEQISDSIGDTVSKTMADISTVVSEAADDTAKMADLDTHNQVKPESGKDKKVSQIKEITADQKTERKTKANSYKDMIENVAGQLQPQVGILNLMATKPAKVSKPAKTRAPRKPSKKPTKVEVRKLSKPVEPSESSPAKSADDSANN